MYNIILGFEVKNVKTFMGMEGYGFNATLYKDGKRVATIIDDATGGEISISFFDKDLKHKDELELLKEYDKEILSKGYEYDDIYKNEDGTYIENDHFMRMESFINDLVNLYLDNKQYKREAKTKTLVKFKDQADGVYTIYKAKYNLNVKKSIEKKAAREKKEIVEFINERFVS